MGENGIDFKKFCKYIPVLILFVILILWHLGLPISADDGYFQRLLTQMPLFSFDGNNLLVMRYMTWSSRSLIELNTALLVSLPDIVWKVLNSIIYCLIAVLITELSFKSKNSFAIEDQMMFYSFSCLFIAVFFLSFEHILRPAGWIITTTNYVWTIFFALLHFYLVKKYVWNPDNAMNKPSMLITIISMIALLEAINSEQILALVSFVYLIMTVYLKINKMKMPKLFYGSWILIILTYIYIFLCPGNDIRYLTAIEKLFPGWYNLTLINKIDFGFNVFLNWCTTQADLITLSFFAIFAIYTIIVLKKQKFSFISLIPLCIAILFWIFEFMGFGMIHDALFLTRDTIFTMPLNLKIEYLAINTIVSLSIIISIYLMYKQNKKNSSVMMLLLLIVLCIMSAGVSGFTPTFNSMGRTYLFSYFIMIFANLVMITDICEIIKIGNNN